MVGRGLLISISGVDGSGKTTQVDLLEKRVRSAGLKLSKVWSRWRPMSSLPLLALLKRLGYSKTYATSSIGFVETRLSNTTGLASVWCFLTQVDNLVKTGVKVTLPLLTGRTVICDRYTLDLLVESMADLHDSPSSRRLGYKLLRLLPRPNKAFLIEVDPEVAFKRKPDMPTISHFIERIQLYRELAPNLGVQLIDGRLPLDTIREKIWSEVSQILS